tara:strand:+ start:7126 stop:7362 length:237 start_codon:yes stop_codon:yes gene_type:complete
MYECLECQTEWKVNHGMLEEEEQCAECKSTNIGRKISDFTLTFKKQVVKKKTGDLTKEFIENSKKDLKQHKRELDKSR